MCVSVCVRQPVRMGVLKEDMHLSVCESLDECMSVYVSDWMVVCQCVYECMSVSR